ncbi:ABC transporter substrate-binding protein [Ornithinicoccus hortensis]|uniref:Peptide/nickel transport system substrate-binding protein n=1 Tax=Ornithinicoccus hortensis TaxID=82346 RepID=A0A542YMI7_9MICO|nr:ABC transporter substrate-binding protein [Ornithinicoccus hortensis]TQL49293.1 peptide/nickel transport system substrate-binding protein [Ornithinicoccus hortensis]
MNHTTRPTFRAGAARHRASRHTLLAPGALGATLLLAACAPGGATETDGEGGDGAAASALPASAPEEVTPGGALRFAVGSDQGCVDPQQVGSNDTIYSIRHLVDSLTDQDPETGEIVPWLAESWEVNDDASAYTFHLQEGATFSDGTPVDAEAVKTNLDRATDIGARGALIKGYLDGYAGTTVEDDRTFTVEFDRPNAQFLQATSTHTLGLLSPESAAQSDDERCASVVGSGPFTLENYEPNSSITLAKREGYDWGSSLWQHTGEAYLDTLEFSVVPESGVRSGSLQSGQVDVIGNIAPQDEEPLKAADAQLLARANPGIPFGLYVNHDNEVLSDPAVTEAIALAINREEIVETVYTTYNVPATSVLASTTPLYADQSEHLRFDPVAAEAALTEAGYAKGEDGVYAKDGQRASFDILWFNNAATNAPTLELIQQQLASVGIEVTLTEGQVADWAATVAEGNFDANWGNITRADADILRGSFHTGLANSYRLEPSDLDDVLEAQAGAADPAERAELAARAQAQIVTERHVVPVVELTTVLGVGPTVQGVAFDAGSRVQLYDAWIER